MRERRTHPPGLIEVPFDLHGRWLQETLRAIDSADPKSLDGMNRALNAAIAYLYLRGDEGDARMVAVIMPLMELKLALSMATKGELHPAFEITKNHSQRRAYTPVQRNFIETCMWSSDGLMAAGLSRREADRQVQKWAKNHAARLQISMSSKDALKHIRKRVGRTISESRRQFESRQFEVMRHLRQGDEEDQELVTRWVEIYRRQIEEFQDQWAFY